MTQEELEEQKKREKEAMANPEKIVVPPAKPAELTIPSTDALKSNIPQPTPSRRELRQADRQQRADNLLAKVNEIYAAKGDDMTAEDISAYVSAPDLWAYQTVYGDKKGRADTFFMRPELSNNAIPDVTFNDMLSRARANAAQQQRANQTAEDKVLAQLSNGSNFTQNQRNAIREAAASGDYNALRDALVSSIGEVEVPEGSTLYDALYDIADPDLESYPENATPEQKAEVDARNAEMMRRSNALAQVINNAGISYDPATGAYSVAEDPKSINDMLRERNRQKMDEEIQLRNQMRANERRRNAVGFADLAASIGDTIKGATGAPVTPRDYRALYDNLDKRSQKLYDNYLAREQYEKEVERQRAQAAREQEEKLEQIRLKGEEDRKTAKQKADDDAKKADAANDVKLKIAQLRNQGMSEREAKRQAAREAAASGKFEGVFDFNDVHFGATKNSGEIGKIRKVYVIVNRVLDDAIKECKENGNTALSDVLSKIRREDVQKAGLYSETDTFNSVVQKLGMIDLEPTIPTELKDKLTKLIKQDYPTIIDEDGGGDWFGK